MFGGPVFLGRPSPNGLGLEPTHHFARALDWALGSGGWAWLAGLNAIKRKIPQWFANKQLWFPVVSQCRLAYPKITATATLAPRTNDIYDRVVPGRGWGGGRATMCLFRRCAGSNTMTCDTVGATRYPVRLARSCLLLAKRGWHSAN